MTIRPGAEAMASSTSAAGNLTRLPSGTKAPACLEHLQRLAVVEADAGAPQHLQRRQVQVLQLAVRQHRKLRPRKQHRIHGFHAFPLLPRFPDFQTAPTPPPSAPAPSRYSPSSWRRTAAGSPRRCGQRPCPAAPPHPPPPANSRPARPTTGQRPGRWERHRTRPGQRAAHAGDGVQPGDDAVAAAAKGRPPPRPRRLAGR